MADTIQLTDCDCESADHHGQIDRLYYVTVLNEAQNDARFALGPFKTHREAQAQVYAVRNLIIKRDPKGPWYRYGTSGVSADLNPLPTAVFGVSL